MMVIRPLLRFAGCHHTLLLKLIILARCMLIAAVAR